jgi:aldehyde dehydrogenase (NAD+)
MMSAPAIGGVEDRVVSTSPQAPGDIVVDISAVSPEAVEGCANGARAAQAAWAAAPALDRATALINAAEAVAAAAPELAELVCREVGKPKLESVAEVSRTIAILRFYAQQAMAAAGEVYPANGPQETLLLTRLRPHGLATLVTPWNFPLMIPAWKLAPALAYGNGVLLKPAPAATACALRLGELLAPALPEGLIQVLPGGARTGSAAMNAADIVSFTGSTAVGKALISQAHERGIPVQAEMGGLNASIVLPGAEPERAAATIAGAAMGYAGQKCTATSRVIVVGDQPRFLDALVSAVRSLPSGDPRALETVVGPVISEPARAAVLHAAARAQSEGGRTLTGGGRADPGWYVDPIVVTDLQPSSWAAQNEVFGPFCVVLRVETVDQAVEVANGTAFGLATAVFTSDLDLALRLPGRLRTGMVRVNAGTTGVDFQAPFGGIGDSGHGERELGDATQRFYTWQQTVTLHPHRPAG